MVQLRFDCLYDTQQKSLRCRRIDGDEKLVDLPDPDRIEEPHIHADPESGERFDRLFTA